MLKRHIDGLPGQSTTALLLIGLTVGLRLNVVPIANDQLGGQVQKFGPPFAKKTKKDDSFASDSPSSVILYI